MCVCVCKLTETFAQLTSTAEPSGEATTTVSVWLLLDRSVTVLTVVENTSMRTVG